MEPDDFREQLSAEGTTGRLLAAREEPWEGLGPLEQWPAQLRTAVQLCLGSQLPAVVAWGPDFRWIYNDAYAPLLGARHPDALGRPAAEVWPDVWSHVDGLFRACLEDGRASNIENADFVTERNGYPEQIHVTSSISPIRLDAGVGGVLCLVQEVTSQVIGARRLELLNRLGHLSSGPERTARSVCSDAAAVLDDATEDVPFSLLYLVDANNVGDGTAELVAWSGIGGRPRPELRDVRPGSGEDVWRFAEALEAGHLLLVDDPDVHLDALTGAGRAVVVPLQMESPRVTTVGYLVAGASPLRPLDQEYRGFFRLLASQLAGSVADVRAYEQQRAQVVALAELDRAKSTFFSNVSHEFRTPLTLLLSPLQDALDDEQHPLAPEQHARLELAHRNAERMRRLVDGLLDFARLDAGRAEPNRQLVELDQLTADIASVFRAAVERAGLHLHLELERLPHPVSLDPDMWEHIVTNLLSNALKYTFVGEICVGLTVDGAHAVLEVSDTGIGIAPEERQRVFERFHRVRDPQARVHEGTGIGLSLVRAYAELHGGQVAVDSEPGKGSTFTVRLPVEPAAPVPPTLDDGVADPAPSVRRHHEQDAPDAVADDDDPRPRVLVVDDNADMRDYLARLLGRQFQVQTAVDGLDALDSIARQSPDVVVSDVMMPNLDGFGLVREVRANPAIASLPVVLLTARAGDSAVAEGLGSGADDYLVKPFKSDELLARVAAHARRAGATTADAGEHRTTDEHDEHEDGHAEPASVVMDLDAEAARPTVRRDGNLLAMELPRRHHALRAMREELRSYLERVGMPPEDADEVVLAVNEAAANAIEHPREPSRPIVDVTCRVDDGELVVTVQDYGTWRERQASMDRGRGSLFMSSFADVTVTPRSVGTEVILRRPVGGRR